MPAFADTHPDTTFDLVFVDGGHTHEIAIGDIRSLRRLAHADTILVVDDMLPHRPWGVGVISAWTEAIATGVVAQSALVADGVEVDLVGPDASRAWVVG